MTTDLGFPWHTDLYSTALRTGRGPLFLRRTDGWMLPLEIERWCDHADAADLGVLRRCSGTVLDIGCGPGRLVTALSALGHQVLGIDISQAAVARTVAAGGVAIRRSVFEFLPGEGGWDTALLMDGNIGIGGDPLALLERAAELVVPSGRLLAEAAPWDVDERVDVHVDDGSGARGEVFPWARVGASALERLAEKAGWSMMDRWSAGGRAFLELRRTGTP